MKLFLTMLLFCLCACAQVTLSTAVEPGLPGNRGSIASSVAILAPLGTSDNALSFRYGFGGTELLGVGRKLVDLDSTISLVGDIQGGVTKTSVGQRGLLVYGAGVSAYLGKNYSITWGAHLNKRVGLAVYPSVFMSLAKKF